MPRISVTDVGGSLNQGAAPSEIASNEYTDLQNFYQFGGRLRRRGGMRRLTTTPFSEPVTGMTYYKPEIEPVGGVDMLLFSSSQIGRMSGATITDVLLEAGFAIDGSEDRWVAFQYKNIGYGLREGVGLVRCDGVIAGPGGITAPDTAPVLADGGAGDIPAADFVGVYTYYNANTGLESNPSPESNTLAHAGAMDIAWSGIVPSTNSQVTHIRLYRSLPDQVGEFFRVATITNSETTYDDDVLAQDLGDAASFTNDVPPEDIKIGDVWNERLFCSDGKLLFYSQIGMIEAFDPEAFIPVFPDDGHPIRAVHGHGDRLMIGKTNKIHYLTGVGPSSFQLFTLTDRHGCISHHSMQSAEGYLFWLGQDNVYRSDGSNVVGIASIKLRTIIENMNETQAENAFATVFPELGLYVLTIPDYAQLFYNYRTDTWAEEPTAEGVHMLGDFFTEEKVQQMYASDAAGHIYRFADDTYNYDDTRDDKRNPIEATFTTRAFGPESFQGIPPGYAAIALRAGLLCAAVPATISLAFESEGVTLKSRTGLSLNLESRWKLYALSTAASAKSRVQLTATYTGAPPLEIEGFCFDLEPIARPHTLAH